MTIERRSMTLDHHGSNTCTCISGSQQSFLTEMAILFTLPNDRYGLGYRFVPKSAIINRQVIHVNLFVVFFFLLYFAGPPLVRTKKF